MYLFDMATCDYCLIDYHKIRANQQYCSRKCKQANYNKINREYLEQSGAWTCEACGDSNRLSLQFYLRDRSNRNRSVHVYQYQLSFNVSELSKFVEKLQRFKCLYYKCYRAQYPEEIGVDPRRLEHGEASKRKLFREYKKQAKVRKLKYELSLDDFTKLTSGNCHYCNGEPQQSYMATSGPRINKSGTIIVGHGFGPYVYNGIDRLDSNIGYILDNCVSCCKRCNYMKYTQTVEEFLDHVAKIYKYQRGST